MIFLKIRSSVLLCFMGLTSADQSRDAVLLHMRTGFRRFAARHGLFFGCKIFLCLRASGMAESAARLVSARCSRAVSPDMTGRLSGQSELTG
jgi:hypothetical protein